MPHQLINISYDNIAKFLFPDSEVVIVNAFDG